MFEGVVIWGCMNVDTRVPGRSMVRRASLDRGEGSDMRRFERYG